MNRIYNVRCLFQTNGVRRLSARLGFHGLFVASLLAGSAAVAETPPTIPSLSTVAATPHPRTAKSASLPAATLRLLSDQVNRYLQEALPAEPDWVPLTSTTSSVAARASTYVAAVAGNSADRMIGAAYHGLLTGDAASKADARRRALHFAQWSSRGATGVWYQDQAARSLAWGLALTYDWLYPTWTDGERKLILAAIQARVEDMLGAKMEGYPTGWAPLEGGTSIDREPYDSHGTTTMAQLAVICSALVGEDPAFSRCYSQTVPRYVANPMPWGGDDGGFANGTAYSTWAVYGTQLVVWDFLKSTLGVDMWQTKWAQNHFDYLAYFMPPGSPGNVFGDGAERELNLEWAGQAKAYAAHYANPLADWYAKSHSGENPIHLPLLMSPRRDWASVSAPYPAGTPASIQIPSIGWVAMHSDLANTARTSVYFKSSPYGSFNHSHADQNSFVINARGSALAIDSGYYDYYGSPHWLDWYKQTRAHNAITFDGGQGQLHDTLSAKGRIVKFENKGDYDIATGDAVVAYGGALTQALRTIVFLKPNTIIVMDNLASKSPRTWEWNLHAAAQMKEIDARHLEVETNGVRLCTNLVYAPNGAFAQTDRFSTAPQGNNTAQWHARFSTTTKTETARFIAVLGVDCAGADASVRDAGGKLVLRVAGREVVFDTPDKVAGR